MSDLELTLKLKGDKDILCDQETLDEYYNGCWKTFLENMIKEEGKFEFMDWFDIVEIEEVEV